MYGNMLDDQSGHFAGGPADIGEEPHFEVRSTGDDPDSDGVGYPYITMKGRKDGQKVEEAQSAPEPQRTSPPLEVAISLLDAMKLKELKEHLQQQKASVGSVQEVIARKFRKTFFPMQQIREVMRPSGESEIRDFSSLEEILESLKRSLVQIKITNAFNILERNYERIIEMYVQNLLAERKYTAVAEFLEQFKSEKPSHKKKNVDIEEKVVSVSSENHEEIYNRSITKAVQGGSYGEAIHLALEAVAFFNFKQPKQTLGRKNKERSLEL